MKVIEKIRKCLNSTYLHIAVIVLVLLDSLFVTIELTIDAEAKTENENGEKNEAAKVNSTLLYLMYFTQIAFEFYNL